MSNPRLFRDVVVELTRLADRGLGEAEMLSAAEPLMRELLASDTWIPDRFCEPDPDRYRQYLLHCDLQQRFSIVSFVWGPGQETPIHDHTVWGLLGVLRGCEIGQKFVKGDDGMHPAGPADYMESGAIDMVSPRIGDIHKVKNGLKGRASVSIHLYGANIGAVNRHTFGADGSVKNFRSGYSLDIVPNLWIDS
jgi:predicted metal-dependent enzyme (double-stranded beta helix superfamily)